MEITQVDDSIRWFIEEKMKEIGEYVEEESNNVFDNEHYNYVHINKEGRIDSFGMIRKVGDNYLFGYSWCDKTIEGKRAYATGIKFLIKTFGSISIQEQDLIYNKFKRMIGD